MAENSTARPSAKTIAVGASGIGGGVIVAWIASLLGVDMPEQVAAAIAGLIALLVAWLVPARSGKYVDTEAARARIPKH